MMKEEWDERKLGRFFDNGLRRARGEALAMGARLYMYNPCRIYWQVQPTNPTVLISTTVESIFTENPF